MKIFSALLPLLGMMNAVENQEKTIISTPSLTKRVAYSALLRKGETWSNPEKEFSYSAIVEMNDFIHPHIHIISINAPNLDLNAEVKPVINRNIAIYIKQKSFLAEKFSIRLTGEIQAVTHTIDLSTDKSEWRGRFDEKDI